MNDVFSHAARLQPTSYSSAQVASSSNENDPKNDLRNELETSGDLTDPLRIYSVGFNLRKSDSTPLNDAQTVESFSPEEFSAEPPRVASHIPLPVITKRLPNGAIMTEDPNNLQPYRVITWPDGTRLVEHYMDGINVLEQPDGSRTTTFADGSEIRTFPSGKKIINRP